MKREDVPDRTQERWEVRLWLHRAGDLANMTLAE